MPETRLEYSTPTRVASGYAWRSERTMPTPGCGLPPQYRPLTNIFIGLQIRKEGPTPKTGVGKGEKLEIQGRIAAWEAAHRDAEPEKLILVKLLTGLNFILP